MFNKTIKFVFLINVILVAAYLTLLGFGIYIVFHILEHFHIL